LKIQNIILKITPYYYKNHLFISTNQIKLDFTKQANEYTIHFPADLSIISKFSSSKIDFTIEDFKKILQCSNQILIVTWKKEIVHRTILQNHGKVLMEGDRNAFILNQNERYVHSCFTSFEHRSKGLYTYVLNYILNTSISNTIPIKVFIACRQKNIASVRGITKAGFKYYKSSKILGILSGIFRYRIWYIKNLEI
jgi:hypothetical protein